MANKGLISISHGERSRVNKLTAGIAFDQVDDIAKLLLSSERRTSNTSSNCGKFWKRERCRSRRSFARRRISPSCARWSRISAASWGQDKAFIQADIAFHLAIAKISGNPLILAVTQAMLSWLFEYYKPLLKWAGREQTTLLEHDKIVDFLASGDAAGAIQMMGAHLGRSDPLYTGEGH